eukprot:tig00000692_g3271.t1
MAAAFACAVPVWRSSSCIIAQPVRSSTAPAPSVGSTARRTSPSFQVRCDSTPPASSDGAARSRLPRTLLETADQARVAAKQAIDDGKNLLEIQFPVTSDKDPDVARILDGNMDALRIFVAPFELLGRRLRLVFPNEEEAGIAKSRVFGNVSFKVSALSREPAPEDELQIVINPTWNIDEILNSEKLWIKTGKKPMILFNAELEKIKGNIGWPGYPSRAFDERFLSVHGASSSWWDQGTAKRAQVLNIAAFLKLKSGQHFQLCLMSYPELPAARKSTQSLF